MEKKMYIKPVTKKVLLNTKENVLDFPFFDTSVSDGLGKENDMTVVDDEEEDEELEDDSVKYVRSYKRYKPFDDWKGTVLDW